MFMAEPEVSEVLMENAVESGYALQADTRPPVVILGAGQEDVLSLFGETLAKTPWRVNAVDEIRQDYALDRYIIGLPAAQAKDKVDEIDTAKFVTIHVHCVDAGAIPDELLSEKCEYQFLFSRSTFLRREVARFLSFILGHVDHHSGLVRKERSAFISTTFPDVRAALPNLDILSVGSDAVELRVDLLEEKLEDGSINPIPSPKYVAEQYMLLRQRSELPIIFTTRCVPENGRFPRDDALVFYRFLVQAIKWGCEYIDVEVWLPEDLRVDLWRRKGNARIISAFHDFSGSFKWADQKAEEIYVESGKHSDIVKMVNIVENASMNYELEYFRSNIKSKYAHPLLSAVNAGKMGQLSRALNTVFSPITHPLLPMVAAPGQLSAAEINEALHKMGQLPKKDIYAFGSTQTTASATFFEKSFNELGLPHRFVTVDRKTKGSLQSYVSDPDFGGACISPPLNASQPFVHSVSAAAYQTGLIDTLLIRNVNDAPKIVGENCMWKGIRATLTRDFVPSAYWGRAALVLASTAEEAAPIVYALQSLKIGPIYSIGFKGSGSLFSRVEPIISAESIQQSEHPFAIVSALPPEKSHLVQPLLRHFSTLTNGKTAHKGAGRVFVDLAHGPRKHDPIIAANSAGWVAYGVADVRAWTTVETLRSLIGQNVPYDFVRMASGRGLS